MRNPRLASRYAKSLLDLAIERNSVPETLADIQLLNSVCRSSREFKVMLQSPVVPGAKKLSVINAVVSDRLHELTKAFISLLVTKGRELNLPEIGEAFIDQYNILKNIKIVKVTTAAAMDEKMKGTIMDKIATFMPGATIQLTSVIDENLIGGFVLEVGDRLFDASVKKKLNDIKTDIVDYSYVNRM
ncbi:MAG: ATP synthase F1 subunit delta [Taibaiella sp.]|nr:ATP synthase F1 subunit delta [Taibaiella sp.]